LNLAGEEQRDLQRKEIVDLKRAINEEIREKEAIGRTADELRSKVKICEQDKTDLGRALQDAKQRIGGESERCVCVMGCEHLW
jgi:hypothetical protein